MTSLQIQYFLSLADTLNFTATARQFYVTQPVISRQISALEHEAGFPLFDRDHHAVALTPGGKILRDCFDESLRAYRLALERARKLQPQNAAVIRLGLMDYTPDRRILDAVHRVQAQFPEVEILLVRTPFSLTAHSLLGDSLDLAFTFAEYIAGSGELTWQAIAPTRDCIFVSPRHPLLRDGPLTPDRLQGQSIYLSYPPDGGRVLPNYPIFRLAKDPRFAACAFVRLANSRSVIAQVESFAVIGAVNNSILSQEKDRFVTLELEEAAQLGLAWRREDSRPVISALVRELSRLNLTF